MQPKFYVVICVFAAFLYRSAAYVERPEREENSLIPQDLKVLGYSLFIELEEPEKEYLFFGTVIITLECFKPTSEIILNMKDLFLDNNGVTAVKQLSYSKTEPLITLEPMMDTVKEWLHIGLETELQEKEKIEIQIDYHKFASKYRDGGIVRYNYIRKNDNHRKWVTVSIPGPVNARRLYPCIDEITVKTEVRVNVAHEENLNSFGNTKIIFNEIKHNTLPSSAKFISEPYYYTPDLSTFAIGFVVGEFESIQKYEETSATYIRISSDKDVMKEIDFAADTAVNILKFCTKHLNKFYSILQIDIVALPFYGRTEKWYYGLIILEASLITNEKSSTQVRQIETAFTLCEVFCQQYFGPPTTFESWSENWLNIGLALFYRIPCLDYVFPDAKTDIANIHLVEAFIRVLSVDAEIKSRPLMVPDSRIDLTNLFEDTTYILAETAYFLIRMMSYSLGEDVLTKQVQNYIAEFKFKVASLPKLLEKFPLEEKNSKLLPESTTFKAIIDSWTSKEGFAHIKMTRNAEDKFVMIQQELPVDSGTNLKFIPLNFITRSESKKKAVEKLEEMKKAASKQKAAKTPAGKSKSIKKAIQEEPVQYWLHSEPIEIPVEINDWIVLSSRLNVLCRVEYDPITLELIRKTLMKKKLLGLIDVTSRAHFISNIFASAEMGKLSYTIVLRFMSYLRNENSVLPVMVALHELNRICLALFGTEIFSEFQAYVLTILKSIIKRKKFNMRKISEDKYEEYYFQKLILTSACTFRDAACVKQSVAHFANLIKDDDLTAKADRIPAVLREPFYCQAIREGSDAEWDFLNSLYSSEHWDSLNDIILNALACTTDDIKITEYLQRILDPEKIAPRDRLTVFKSVASNEKGYILMRSFFYDKVDELLELHEDDPSQINRYLEVLYENTWTSEDFEELKDFIASNAELKNIVLHLEESKMVAKKNIAWLTSMKVGIPHFFEERKIRLRLGKRIRQQIRKTLHLNGKAQKENQ